MKLVLRHFNKYNLLLNQKLFHNMLKGMLHHQVSFDMFVCLDNFLLN
jgi:hypothetical protein